MIRSTVLSEHTGQRLDVYATGLLPRLSRAFAQHLIEEGRVAVNGKSCKPGLKVHEGDEIKIDYDESELDHISNIDLPILYEDDDCIVINKPSGILTHSPGALKPEATVATYLRSKFQGLGSDRAGIVHRLDRATSGVIIGAKSQKALSFLQKQFARRKVKKTYIAVVSGSLTPSEAIIDMPIERNPKAPATFRAGVNGKPAVTHYKVLKENSLYSQLELKPETGRTHQLRVHLAKIGHPVVGDPLYGEGNYGDRLFLHAHILEITLPNTERKVFTAPLPKEFEEIMHVK